MYGVESEVTAIAVPAGLKDILLPIDPAGTVAGFAYLVPNPAENGHAAALGEVSKLAAITVTAALKIAPDPLKAPKAAGFAYLVPKPAVDHG